MLGLRADSVSFLERSAAGKIPAASVLGTDAWSRRSLVRLRGAGSFSDFVSVIARQTIADAAVDRCSLG